METRRLAIRLKCIKAIVSLEKRFSLKAFQFNLEKQDPFVSELSVHTDDFRLKDY